MSELVELYWSGRAAQLASLLSRSLTVMDTTQTTTLRYCAVHLLHPEDFLTVMGLNSTFP